MEAMVNFALIQSGVMVIRLLALFGLVMILIMLYNLLFKGNYLLLFIFPAQLLVPVASAAYFVSFIYRTATYVRSYSDVWFTGSAFFISYLAAMLLQKSYERIVKGNPKPYDTGLIIICAFLTFAFAVYVLYALTGYNFLDIVNELFRNIFQWLGLYTPETPGEYRGRP